jgi:hypothetical protein
MYSIVSTVSVTSSTLAHCVVFWNFGEEVVEAVEKTDGEGGADCYEKGLIPDGGLVVVVLGCHYKSRMWVPSGSSTGSKD